MHASPSPATSLPPLIITAAITSTRTPQGDPLNLPITPAEQGIAACDAARAGASIIHLHVRDDEGKPTLSSERFASSIS